MMSTLEPWRSVVASVPGVSFVRLLKLLESNHFAILVKSELGDTDYFWEVRIFQEGNVEQQYERLSAVAGELSTLNHFADCTVFVANNNAIVAQWINTGLDLASYIESNFNRGSYADLLWISFQLMNFMHDIEQKTDVDFLPSIEFMTITTTDWIEVRGFILAGDRQLADRSSENFEIDDIIGAYGSVSSSMRAVLYLGYVSFDDFVAKSYSNCLVKILTNFAVEEEVGSELLNARQAEFLLSGNGVTPAFCKLLLAMISPISEERPELDFVYEKCRSELMPLSFHEFLHPYFAILPVHLKPNFQIKSLLDRRALSMRKLVDDFEDLKHVVNRIDDASSRPLLLERAMLALVFGCSDSQLAIKALTQLLSLKVNWSAKDFCCCILPRLVVVYQHSALDLCFAIWTAVESCTSLITGQLLPAAISLIHSVVVQEERKMLFGHGMSIIFSVLEENSSTNDFTELNNIRTTAELCQTTLIQFTFLQRLFSPDVIVSLMRRHKSVEIHRLCLSILLDERRELEISEFMIADVCNVACRDTLDLVLQFILVQKSKSSFATNSWSQDTSALVEYLIVCSQLDPFPSVRDAGLLLMKAHNQCEWMTKFGIDVNALADCTPITSDFLDTILSDPHAPDDPTNLSAHIVDLESRTNLGLELIRTDSQKAKWLKPLL